MPWIALRDYKVFCSPRGDSGLSFDWGQAASPIGFAEAVAPWGICTTTISSQHHMLLHTLRWKVLVKPVLKYCRNAYITNAHARSEQQLCTVKASAWKRRTTSLLLSRASKS